MFPFVCSIGPNTKFVKGRIPCDECSTKCNTWASLIHHKEEKHGHSASQMSGHYIAEQAALEKAKAEDPMTALEIEHVGCHDDITKFVCKTCAIPLSKESALRHFTLSAKHKGTLDKDTVKQWVVYKDSVCIGKKKTYLCRLHLCHPEKAGSGEPVVERAPKAGNDEPVVGDAPSDTDQPDSSLCDASVPAFEWKRMVCLVKCHPGGEPAYPLDCKLPVMEPKAKAKAVADIHAYDESDGAQVPMQMGMMTKLLQQLVQQVETTTGPQKLEVVVPNLVVTDDAEAWVHPVDKKFRNHYPSMEPSQMSVNIAGFARYLVWNLNQEDGSTARGYQKAVVRLFNLVDTADGWTDDVDFKACLVAMHKNNLVYSLMQLPLMDLRYGWSRQIVFALCHLCNFGMAEAERLEIPRTKWFLGQLQHNFLNPWKVRAFEAKKKGSIQKQELDGLRLEKLPSPQECKAAVHKAMCHLAIVAEDASANGTMTTQEKQLANVAIAGIIMYGTFAGRSMEWHLMERESVQQKMLEGTNRLVCGKHKTCKYYGSIAKWVPPGLRQALLTYCKLPDKESDKLFEPATATCDSAKHFYIGVALKAFGRHYTPKHEHPRVNLIRKMFHSILLKLSREGEAMKLIGAADGHSAAMGLKTRSMSRTSQPHWSCWSSMPTMPALHSRSPSAAMGTLRVAPGCTCHPSTSNG